MKSKTSVNLKFQRRVKQIRPRELLLDIVESALMKRVEEGSVQAVIYMLKTKGKDRGWGKTEPVPQVDAPSKDVKVNGVSENTYKALVVGHEVRVTGQWQSKTFKKGDTQHRYYHLHAAHPCNFTLLSKPRKQQEVVGQPAPALNGQGSTR